MPLLKSILPTLTILADILPAGGTQSVFALDNTKYCNAVQNKVGLIRYPLGTIGLSSTSSGEIADTMTLVPRVYPCVGSVVVRPASDDWRASISGDPSMLTVKYKADKPSGSMCLRIGGTDPKDLMAVCSYQGTNDSGSCCFGIKAQPS